MPPIETNMEMLANANWEKIRTEVNQRIDFLEAACKKLEKNHLSDMIAKDLILPNIALLGEFCTNIVIE